jgi:hypothetical protein
MLFLDDVRTPDMCLNYMYDRIGLSVGLYSGKWKVVSNYDEFAQAIINHHHEITHISFDHDLGEDVALEAIERGMSKTQARKKLKKNVKSGYDCAIFTIQYYKQLGKPLPIIIVHSMNPPGAERIKNIFKDEKKES